MVIFIDLVDVVSEIIYILYLHTGTGTRFYGNLVNNQESYFSKYSIRIRQDSDPEHIPKAHLESDLRIV